MQSRNDATDHNTLSDGQLAALYRSGDQEAFAELAVRYMAVIRSKASDLDFPGVEADDLFQEGLIALDSAARSFQSAGTASFRTYAGVCIRNRLVSALRRAGSDKNKLNVTALSLEDQLDAAASPDTEPENVVLTKLELAELWQKIGSGLSKTELDVLRLYLEGSSFQQTSEKLGISVKSCNNAMQRVRRKLRAII